MMFLLHVLAWTWPSTWRAPTKRTAVTDSVKKYAYVESKIEYCQIKLLKVFICRLLSNTFHIKLSVIADLSFWGSYPCVVSMCWYHGRSLSTGFDKHGHRPSTTVKLGLTSENQLSGGVVVPGAVVTVHGLTRSYLHRYSQFNMPMQTKRRTAH
jgi:hypothetical protein